MDQERTSGRTAKIAGVLVVAISLCMALLIMAAPDARAHGGKFDHDSAVFEGSSCVDPDVPNGATATSFGRTIIGCTPVGYVLIGSDTALCEEARGRFIDDICTFDRARECGTRPDFLLKVESGCIRPALVQEEFAPAPPPEPEKPFTPRSLATPACVNSELAKTNAYSQLVGGNFIAAGQTYVIVSGPSCGFNCVDGWDINCDGKVGDFCRSELDLESVADVADCLEEMAAKTNDTPT